MTNIPNNIIKIIPATHTNYPVIQNMARFYAYDLSRFCGFISSDWDFPENGLYESFDSKIYFEDPTRKAYLVKVENELAGFVLLNQEGLEATTNWNIGEFFVIAKFQGKGVAKSIAKQIWDNHPGIFEVAVIPENKPACAFWQKSITAYTNGDYICQTRTVSYDEH